MTKLTEEQIAVHLNTLPGWRYDNDALIKTFEKADFREAVAFVGRIADLAEAANHHPDLTIRFKRVTVSLTTHKARGVSGRDFLLAQQIEGLNSPRRTEAG